MRIPIVIQMQPGENGAAALCMILGGYKRFVPLEEMREKCISSRNGSSPEQIVRAAASYGLNARVEEVDIDDFSRIGFPLMVHWKRRYYCIVRSVKKGIVSVTDPARGEYRMTLEKFSTLYNGRVILFEKTPQFMPGGKRTSLFSLVKDRLISLKTTFAALSLFSLLCAGMSLQMAFISKLILDYHLTGNIPNETDVIAAKLISLYLLCLLVYSVAGVVRTRLANKASRNASADSGRQLFKHMFNQPLKFFEQFSAGELISRIDANTSINNSIIRFLVPRGIDAVMTLVYIVNLFMYNPVIAAVCLILVILHIGVNLNLQEKRAIASRSMATGMGTVRTTLLNGMNMIETIKSTGGENDFFNLWYDNQKHLNDNRLLNLQIGALTTFFSWIHKYTLSGVQLFMGACFIINGDFTLGTMALFESILNSMIISMNNCMSMTDLLQQMRTSVERVNDINNRHMKESISLPKSEYDFVDKLSGSLVAKHISYRYNQGDTPAVDDVSIEVKQGQMVALVGSTGCGKSTLLKILSGLYEAETGEILYSGRRREEIPDVVFHSSVATVDQETVMFEDSVYNNIRMWDPTIENYEVIMAARDAQIYNRIIRDPRSFGADVKENGRNFSGGELQRLELARALSHEPTLMFLDEFTSSLDSLTEDRIIRSIKEKGTTCIIVAHRLSTIVDCDRIYVMEHGRIVSEGTHSELYAKEGLYRELIQTQ